MPISVVVGGQYGSEGKGKVAAAVARERGAAAVVRVGGTNSGHTAVSEGGRTWILRQLPASAIVPGTKAVLPPGAIIDPEIFQREVALLGLGPDSVLVSPLATVITAADRHEEATGGLVEGIGSTGSGTGAALLKRIARKGAATLAGRVDALRPFLADTSNVLDGILTRQGRIVIEGSQGYGLSVLHGREYPKATSRDTTAAAFLAEADLSPVDVDDVVVVIRAFPIRVAGDSGSLSQETTWAALAERAGLGRDYVELSSATRKERRVGLFEPGVVRRALRANKPHRIALNHMDYFDRDVRNGAFGPDARRFIESMVEREVGRRMTWIGTGPSTLLDRDRI